MDVDESLRASDYASGFMSVIYANRRVPDLSGLVGMQPKAIYIMFPLEPGDAIDTGNSGGVHPNGDETANNDGWAAFSGTSAAAPQLAGAAALVKQACPRLTPLQIKNILMKTARDVTAGRCNRTALHLAGNPAGPGPDLATGNGLVDAHKAVLMAKVTCLGPIIPPILPPIGVQPPIRISPPPILPPIGVQPPIRITPPIRPPIQPILPPISPIVLPPQPPGTAAAATGAEATVTGETAGQLSFEDVTALEDMIVKSEVDLDK